MLHRILDQNRAAVIERCRLKVAGRPDRAAFAVGVDDGMAPLLDQLIETLRLETVRGAPPSGLSSAARKHGGDLLRQGLTIDDVVRDYGDLGQAVAEIALENRAPVSGEDFRAFHRSLGGAIADAVGEFDRQRYERVSETDRRVMNERLGFLAHELRNFLNTAMLSFAAIRSGSVAVNGATSAVLDRSLAGLRDLIDSSLEDVRLAAGMGPRPPEVIAVDQFLSDVQAAAGLEAHARGRRLAVARVEPGLTIQADRPLLHSAAWNLVQNALKFTRPDTEVSLRARAADDRVLIEVEDRCGGLPPGTADKLFSLFEQHHADRSGLGLGLSISRHAVESSGGVIRVRDIPGCGCVFTIDLPRHGQSDALDSVPPYRRL